MAGIDLEPGGHTGWHTEHRLAGITIADSISDNNLGDGISIGLTGLINASWPVEIAVSNYTVLNSSGSGFLLGGGSQQWGADGSISFTDCVVVGAEGPGFSTYHLRSLSFASVIQHSSERTAGIYHTN